MFSGPRWGMAALAMERNILGSSGAVLDGRQDPNHPGKAGDRQGDTKGSLGPGCWRSQWVTSPWAKLLKWGSKVRLPAGGCRD